jgi:hypothetical protein
MQTFLMLNKAGGTNTVTVLFHVVKKCKNNTGQLEYTHIWLRNAHVIYRSYIAHSNSTYIIKNRHSEVDDIAASELCVNPSKRRHLFGQITYKVPSIVVRFQQIKFWQIIWQENLQFSYLVQNKYSYNSILKLWLTKQRLSYMQELCEM